ncbi:MAG: dethiobiotin synthase [Cytophagaceae bacterium]|nr:dethiobiotin synthase [Cytophagaceae bacterium]MDW8455522.1 dethiobiotin synthase [Cytophagaceae bacterium]
MIYFVTAIHTDSGKTVVSAILCKALQADYWKPVQCGLPADTDTVKSLLGNTYSICHQEVYRLKMPASPHVAAKAENINIHLHDIRLPQHDQNTLIIEGAGGILVPLNDNEYVIDIAEKFNAQVILVSNHYLGSINHTLLTCAELKKRNLRVKGIVFNGNPYPEAEEHILRKTGYKCLLRIKPEKEVNEEMITRYAIQLFEQWNE